MGLLEESRRINIMCSASIGLGLAPARSVRVSFRYELLALLAPWALLVSDIFL